MGREREPPVLILRLEPRLALVKRMAAQSIVFSGKKGGGVGGKHGLSSVCEPAGDIIRSARGGKAF